jgi:hypothetical protein
MYIIFYSKSTSVVLNVKEDLAHPASSEEQLFNAFLSDTGLTANSAGYAVLSGVKIVDFETNKYLYNVATNTVSNNPSYVAPTPAPDPTPAT